MTIETQIFIITLLALLVLLVIYLHVRLNLICKTIFKIHLDTVTNQHYFEFLQLRTSQILQRMEINKLAKKKKIKKTEAFGHPKN
tara:strand:+ start:11473 stop:11727 length:255 start_codon:yes stop_codon:yes gene_type:complete